MSGKGQKPETPPVLADWRWLAIISLLAFIVRLLYVFQQRDANPVFDLPFMDAGVHDEWAKRIAGGQGYGPEPYFRAPLYYYLLALVYKLFGPSFLAARVLQALCGSLTCFLLGLLGGRIGGRAVGRVSATIAAVYWPFVLFDAELLTVNLELFLLVLLLNLMFVARDRGEWKWWLSVGLALGLGAITRPTIMPFAVVILGWIWWLHRSGEPQRRPWAAMGVFVAGCVLAIAPVSIRNLAVGKEPVLIATSGGVNFYIGNNESADGYTAIVPGTRPTWWGGYEDTHRIAQASLGHTPTEQEVSNYWSGRAWEWIRSYPGKWASLSAKKARLLAHAEEIPNNQPDEYFFRMSGVGRILAFGFTGLFVLASAGLLARIGRREEWVPLAMYFVVTSLTVIAFFVNGRYRMPLIPVLVVLAACGIVGIVRALLDRQPGRLGWMAVAAAIGFGVVTACSLDRSKFVVSGEAEANYILGNAYLDTTRGRSADYQRALPHFEKAVKLRGTDAEAWFRVAICYFEIQDLERCRTALAKVIELQPDFQPAKDLMARAASRGSGQQDPGTEASRVRADAQRLSQQGRHAEAAGVLEAYVKEHDDFVAGWGDLGIIYRRGKRYADAAKAFERVLKDRPDHPVTLLNLSRLLGSCPDGSVRDGKRALQLADKLLSTAGEEPLILDAKAIALAELRRFKEAVACEDKALNLARAARAEDLVTQLEARRKLFAGNAPYREE